MAVCIGKQICSKFLCRLCIENDNGVPVGNRGFLGWGEEGRIEEGKVLLPPASKWVGFNNFPDQSVVLDGAIAPIASSLGRSEAPSPSTVKPSILHGSPFVTFYRKTLNKKKTGKFFFFNANRQNPISDSQSIRKCILIKKYVFLLYVTFIQNYLFLS